MDIASKKLQEKYAALCQELGDLSLKKEQISKRSEAIKLEIEALNSAYNILAEANAAASKSQQVKNEEKES